jgi:hypothetical protein
MWKFFISGIEVNEPIGWDAVQFTIERKPDAGFSFVFSDTVTFQNKAADIIRQAYNQRFVNALVPIDIVRFKDGSCQQAIDRYSGVLNFKVYQEEGQDVIIGIMDSGIAEKFTANKGTKINLRNETNAEGVELTPLSNDLFDLHSQPLQARANYLINNNVELLITGDPTTLGQCGYTYDGFYGVNFVLAPQQNDLSTIGITARELSSFISVRQDISQALFVNISSNPADLDIELFIDSTALFQIRNIAGVCGDIVEAIGGRWAELYRCVVNPSGTLSAVLLDEIQYTSGGVNVVQFTYSETFTIEPGFALGYFVRYVVRGLALSQTYFNEVNLLSGTYLNASATKQEPPSTCYGQYTYEYLNRILESICGQKNILVSNFFGSPLTNYPYPEYGAGSLTFLTNGLALRNAVDDNGQVFPINDTFQACFEALSKIFGLGYQIEVVDGVSVKVRVEHLSYFYGSTAKTTFTNVDTFTKQPIIDKIYSSVEIGYTDQSLPENYNGVYEFNTKRTFIIPGATVANVLDLVTGYTAGGYSIEVARRLQFFDSTSDYKTDNNIFIICVNAEAVAIDTEEQVETDPWQPDPTAAPGYTRPIGTCSELALVEATGQRWFEVTGDLPFRDLAYNLRVSPARMLIWNWCQIAGSLKGTGNDFFRFSTGTYNSTLTSQATIGQVPEVFGIPISENADLYEANVSEPIRQATYFPEQTTFTIPQLLCEFIKLRNIPGQTIQFTSQGRTFLGIIQTAINEPGNTGFTEFTLILKQ